MNSKLLFAALTGLVMASTAGASEPVKTTEPTIMGECHGINACKGQGQCGTQKHSCAGQNSCKGQGWISMTEKNCKSKKGQWKKSAGMMHGATQK